MFARGWWSRASCRHPTFIPVSPVAAAWPLEKSRGLVPRTQVSDPGDGWGFFCAPAQRAGASAVGASVGRSASSRSTVRLRRRFVSGRSCSCLAQQHVQPTRSRASSQTDTSPAWEFWRARAGACARHTPCLACWRGARPRHPGGTAPIVVGPPNTLAATPASRMRPSTLGRGVLESGRGIGSTRSRSTASTPASLDPADTMTPTTTTWDRTGGKR